jgi:cold-inducible RNA-binding protein
MKKLFVGNIPHSTTEAELRTLFEPHGKIDQVSVVTDRETGRSRGFAFVEMSDSSEAEKAIAALNGKELGGRALNINEARPKTERSSGGPPRGGGPVVGAVAAPAAADVPVVADATTIKGTLVNLANRAGRSYLNRVLPLR